MSLKLHGLGKITGIDQGLSVVGVTTLHNELSVSGDVVVGGGLTVTGVLTYEDVTNVDSIGIITARSGIVGDLTGNVTGDITGNIAGTSTIAGISSSITDTAVDIFVYDTSKDSDGGAWRKRTQHTSWYNETLNTSTRGSRREFPSVAVIVLDDLTTTGRMTIYDGDDPDLPMWMVFTGGDSAQEMLPSFTGTKLVTVSALNGQICVGNNTYDLEIIDFLKDGGTRVSTGQYINNHNISTRNSALQSSSFSTGSGLVDRAVNDVAMTVLPNAPIDETTGLPVPTIAVATDGGASIIRDDGTVVDKGTLSGASYKVGWIGERLFMTAPLYYGIFANIYTEENDQYVSNIADSSYYHSNGNGTSWNYPRPIANFDDGNTSIIPIGSNTIVAGTSQGLNIHQLSNSSIVDNNDGIVAYAATSYNTGWMHGDIKGAFLSDTDTTNITGGNIVTNGDAWTGAQSSTSSTPPNGWTGGNAAQWRTSTGGDGSYIRLVNAGSSQGGPNSYMYQAITTVPGRKYKISLTQYHHATISVYYSVGTSINGGDLVTDTWVSSSSNTPRDEQNTFTATGTTTYLTLGITSGTNNYDTGWDNVLITEVVDDRSPSVNGLHSFGTITKSAVATGAELVVYSGFSNSNVLFQPYNSNLDPGTGDYSFMIWFKCSSTSGEQILMRRFSSSSVTGGMMMRIVSSSSVLQWYVRDTSSNATVLNSTMALDDGNWHCAVGTRQGSNAKLYIDGKLNRNSTCSGSSHNPGNDANLAIGAEEIVGSPGTFQNPADLCSLTLVRYSLSAPSAAQVKKMYEEEKMLFQENAACTLYGSSDAVTALAYDEVTDRLHVGTSSGRSDFQGLRRINNTTTAVTTAISAHDEFIAEQ